MKSWQLMLAVLSIVLVPITYCLAVQAVFTILSAILPFLLGFAFGTGLAGGCCMAVLSVMRPWED